MEQLIIDEITIKKSGSSFIYHLPTGMSRASFLKWKSDNKEGIQFAKKQLSN